MNEIMDAKLLGLLAELVQGAVYLFDETGEMLRQAGPTAAKTVELDRRVQEIVKSCLPGKNRSALMLVNEPDFSCALIFLRQGILVLQNYQMLESKRRFRRIIEDSLPYIAQVAGGDAVLFNEKGVRELALYPDGRQNLKAIGMSTELCYTTMQESRSSIGPSALSPGSTAVRIPLTAEYGIAFNNRFATQQQQRLINNARQYSYARYHIDDIVGNSAVISKVKQLAGSAAQSNTTILLSGETGTGKEMFAQAIHNLSPRTKSPFIAVNCGAVPPELVESTLFGYAGGSFTGAKGGGQVGCFEQANGGTIFLDEISEMPLLVQVKLLRVLQEREITRVGENLPRPVDVRIIASTNQGLKQMVDQGTFRADLYFRLKVLEICIPSLRERPEDILGLINLFIKRFSSMFGKPVYDITPEAIRALVAYPWPGNVRELQNCFEYIFNILEANSHSITIDHLPAGMVVNNARKTKGGSLYSDLMKQTEMDIVSRAMQQCQGNKTEAAKRLGINRTTLWRILKKYNLCD